MAGDLASYARAYPMAPLGGLFLLTVGAFILLGAVAPRARMPLLWSGLALGMTAIFLGGRFQRGLPDPNAIQIGSLAVAILLETIAFAIAMPRVRPRGERTVQATSLLIVGLHFFVMLPAFGPRIGILAALCTLNAVLAFRIPQYRAAWPVDGILKVALGLWLLSTSPSFDRESNPSPRSTVHST
jgi:hypothetical protein